MVADGEKRLKNIQRICKRSIEINFINQQGCLEPRDRISIQIIVFKLIIIPKGRCRISSKILDVFWMEILNL